MASRMSRMSNLCCEGNVISNHECSRLARYLTRKGAGVDPSIRWRTPASQMHTPQVATVCNKRKFEDLVPTSELDRHEHSASGGCEHAPGLQTLRNQWKESTTFRSSMPDFRNHENLNTRRPHWSDSGRAMCTKSALSDESSCDFSSVDSILCSINRLASIDRLNSIGSQGSSRR